MTLPARCPNGAGRLPWVAAVAVAAVIATVAPGTTPAVAQGAAQDVGPEARVVLPPGNSQHFSIDAFLVNGPQELLGAPPDPDAWGPWVDDQRELYWNHEYRDGALRPEPFCDDPQAPRDGVTLCFDDAGVPVVYAGTVEDLWFGVGYGVAQIRMFLTDAIRRTARGTLAELAGPGTDGATIQEDVATRVTTYSADEFDAMLAASSPDAIASAEGYRDGFNAWVDHVTTVRRDLLPAEYDLLLTDPAPLTLTDIAAIGVLLTRFVAAEGRNEMVNVRALRELEDAFGAEEGRRRFEDLAWQEDAEAFTTVPASEGVFPRTTAATDPDARDAAFHAMADFARTVPLELADGDGTGDFDVPPGGLPVLPDTTLSTSGLPDPAAEAARFLEEFRGRLHGGSFLVSIGPDHTADGSTLLMSEPQLLMSPQLLLEIEVHGAGLHARGATAPGLPVLGIGYNNDVAWALTTGNSKTIDSFIETTRPDTDGDGAPEYLHDGQWKNQTCRTETVRWRDAVEGVPVGPPLDAVDVPVCRTVHGPVVATSGDGTLARSTQYAMWGREVETIEGVSRWPAASNLAEFEEAMRRVTWNENTAYADRDGNIAYWHPGLHHVRDPRTDLRLPIPGTGEYDMRGFLDFDDLPHVVNPEQGYLVNWNNKPAHGWLDGGGESASSYPAGHGARAGILDTFIGSRDDWTFEGLQDIDRYAGSQDHRAQHFVPLLLALQGRADLTDIEAAALEVLAAWDGSANGPGADWTFDFDSTPATVGAAATIFHEVMLALPDELFGELRLPDLDWVEEQTSMGRHFYDVSPVLNLALRVLDPSSSSLEPSTNYTGGRTTDEVLLTVLRGVVDDLQAAQGPDPATWRSAYGSMEPICASVGGTIGPCPEMPFLERGSWIHLVGFPGADTPDAPPPAPPGGEVPVPAPDPPADGGPATPSTGGGLALLGVLLAGAAVAGRRRRVAKD